MQTREAGKVGGEELGQRGLRVLMGMDTAVLPQELVALGPAQEQPSAQSVVPRGVCSLQTAQTPQHSPGCSVPRAASGAT